MINRAVNRVVHADIDIVGIGSEILSLCLGNISEGLVGRRSDSFCVAVLLRFGKRLFRPLTGDDIVSLPALVHEVERNGGKLGRSTALKEKHLIVIGNIHQLTQKRFCAVNDRFVDFRTMRHFHNRLTAALIIEHFGGSFIQYGFGQHRRTCRKIIDS